MTKILVVDDEPAIVAGIQAILALHGIQTEGAGDLDAAKERLAEEFYAIVFADLRMRRDDDGFLLLDAVQQISPRTRVATMTAYATPAIEARLRECGAALVLYKPFAEEALLDALRTMLEAIEAAEAAHPDDDEALYTATINTLQAISRGRFGFPREDAEELIQETWLLYLEKRRDVRAPRAWLSGTIANLCRQEIARRQRDRARAAEMPELAVPRNDDDVLSVRTALSRIDERSRALCTLIGMEQQPYADVSASAGIPLGSIGPLYMRAKERLRQAIGN